MRHATILNRQQTALLVIDIQDRVHAVMRYREEVESNAQKLIRGCQLLQVPILLTEQYPQGLGHTISSIRYALQAGAIITTVEMALFELMVRANSAEFKEVSNLIK